VKALRDLLVGLCSLLRTRILRIRTSSSMRRVMSTSRTWMTVLNKIEFLVPEIGSFQMGAGVRIGQFSETPQ
jgi:hypothetical protein